MVKTIGDAVMATFPAPDRAIRAAMAMREAMRRINRERGSEDLALNIGLHSGPCLAVTLDDRQDYFGMAVNVASRVQGLAQPDAILATRSVVESAEVARLVQSAGYRATSKTLSLRGRQRSAGDFRDPRSRRARSAPPESGRFRAFGSTLSHPRRVALALLALAPSRVAGRAAEPHLLIWGTSEPIAAMAADGPTSQD